MKKVFAIFILAVIMTSCDDTNTTSSVEDDSTRAAATADSIEQAAIRALADSAKMMKDRQDVQKDSVK